MKHEKIIEKIKKLLNLATSNNANEAAVALKRAQALMAEHSVTMSDVKLADCSTRSSFLDSLTPNKYEAYFTQMIANAFGVKFVLSIGTHAGKTKCSINFLGISPQPELAQYCFDVLYRQLKTARSEYVKKQSNRCKPTTKTKRGDAFAQSWVLHVYSTVKTFALTDEQERLIESYKSSQFDELVKQKTRDRIGKKKVRVKDVLAGAKAAKGVRLDRPVHGQETAKLSFQ